MAGRGAVNEAPTISDCREGLCMHGRFNGRVALVTGGTSGIGEATAARFVSEGASVILTGRNPARGADVAARLGDRAHFVQAEAGVEDDIARAVSVAVERFGRLDVLFNNAGGPSSGEVESVTLADFRAAFDVLVGGVVFGTKHATPIMRAQGRGAIINNSSVASQRTHLGGYLYSMAKAAVSQQTRLAGMELGRHGITVNCVSPGAIVTPIFVGGLDVAAKDPVRSAQRMTQVEAALGKGTPLLRAGQGDDVANAVLFLASDEGAYINCHDLVVDGGMVVAGRNSFS